MAEPSPPLLSGRRLLIDGGVLVAAFTVFVLGTLWWNVWLWLEDYPPDIQAMVAGRAPEVPVAERAVAGVGFLVIVIGLLLWSTVRRLREPLGDRSRFLSGFAHAFVLYQIVNLWDLVVIDWLVLSTLRPAFVVLPGTEGARGYSDYAFHFQAAYLNPTPWIGCFVLCLLVAAVASWWTRRRRSAA